MNKIVVVVFPDESKAYEGSRAIRELHSEGDLSLQGLTLAEKDESGNVVLSDKAAPGLPNAAIGALVGGFVGILAGPIGLAAGAAGGAWFGTWSDMTRLGIGADFVNEVSRELRPGRAAVIAEIAEDRVTPLDTRMEELDGIVLREWRTEFAEGRLAHEAAAGKAELTQLKSERAQADTGGGARLDARIDKARAKLEEVAKRARERLEELRRETQARVESMRDQAARAEGEKKVRIEQRMTEARADEERRSNLLAQAIDLADEGLS